MTTTLKYSITTSLDHQSHCKSPLIGSTAYSQEFWESTLTSPQKLLFFYQLILKVIESLRSGRYTDFDAHTTSNCCHGMSIFVKDQLLLINHLDLHELQLLLESRIYSINENLLNQKTNLSWLPHSLIDLASLYTLSYTTTPSHKGVMTKTQKLKKISPIGTDFCNKVIKNLQRLFSNLIADSYYQYLNELNYKMEVSGAPINMWGKYVEPSYIRTDKRQVKYASSMFSMQVSLAYLIASQAKIALVTDLVDLSDKSKGRYVAILEGDGASRLTPIDLNELQSSDNQEPIVVFGSCAYSESMSLNSLDLKITPWLHEFPALVQAHEIHYPQFPKVSDDPDFNSHPITPQEAQLKKIIATLSKVVGVSPKDPSFCCFTHIFPASISQVLQVASGENLEALPHSSDYLPKKFKPCRSI